MKTASAFWIVFKSYVCYFIHRISSLFFDNTKSSAKNFDFTFLRYSQLWEDIRTLRRGLAVQDGDVVFTLTAAGDNALGLLLDNPSRVVAIDISPAQTALLSLKIHAIKHLTYEEFTLLLGFRLDDVTVNFPPTTYGPPETIRLQMYEKLRSLLPEDTREFWDNNTAIIKSGIIHCGRLEGFLRLARTCLLAAVHPAGTIEQLFQQTSLANQKRFFNDHWNTWVWRAYHRIIFSSVMLGHAREPSLLTDTSVNNISKNLLKRHTQLFTQLSLSDNFFEEYMLTGNISGKHGLPDYLKPENYPILRQRLDRMEVVNRDIFTYLEEIVDSDVRFDCFNLSDLFEWFPVDVSNRLFESIVKVSNPGARLAYWVLFRDRRRPESLGHRILETELGTDLQKEDRMWSYSSFVVNKIVLDVPRQEGRRVLSPVVD